MPYPSKNTNGYSSTSKNASTFSSGGQSGQNFLMIDSTYFLLIDTDYKLLIEPNTQDWSYSTKS
jgi:hypothetical protein